MIKRNIYNQLVDHLEKREMSIITGPRQAGKTTLMELLKKDLDQKGERTLYLNLDIERDRPFFKSQADFIGKIELEIGKNRGYVFIDEIQRKENAGQFLKGLFDLKLPYKLIVSGSGSLELKEKIQESLVGRKRLFELSTITFNEFVNYKTEYKYENNLIDFFKIEKDKTSQMLMEYMNFGGYPLIVLEDELREKYLIMDEIYRSVIERDLAHLLKIEKTESLSELMKLIAGQIGNLINYSELASTINISFQTVKNYLWYCRKIFLIDFVFPFARNTRKEITKSPVGYFNDLGLRNYLLDFFGYMKTPSECGFVFENLVFLLLRNRFQNSPTKINFWRTQDKAEVDFIINQGREIIPVEVKFKSMKKEEIKRSLRSFIKKYSPPAAYIVTPDFKSEVTIETTRVMFLPYYELLFHSEP